MCLTGLYRSPDAVTAHVHQRAESAVQVEGHWEAVLLLVVCSFDCA